MGKYFFACFIILALQAMQQSEGLKESSSAKPRNRFAREVSLLARGLKKTSESSREGNDSKNSRPKSDQEIDELVNTIKQAFPDICDEELMQIVGATVKTELQRSKCAQTEEGRRPYLVAKRLQESSSSSEKSE